MVPAGQNDWLERLNSTTEGTAWKERRRSLRVPLRWTLYLACQGGTHPRRTETQNLSRDGFYFLLDRPLTAGEYVDCDIVVPTHEPHCQEVISLRCNAQVIRVEKIDGGDEYGLACRIEDYRLMHSPQDEYLPLKSPLVWAGSAR